MEELGEQTLIDQKTGAKTESCALNFIRCIKPNDKSSSNLFVDSLVLLQIGYMGVLDSVKVRKMNFPNRIKYERFYEKCEDLCSVSFLEPIKVLRAKSIERCSDLIRCKFCRA